MTFLYRNNQKWIKNTDLLQFLDVSRKTLRSYLDQLQDLFKDLTHFDYTGSMVQVTFDPNFGLLTLQRTFLQESLMVKILQQNFFHTDLTKLDLIIDLNTSETSIYRACQTFNQEIDGVYDLTYLIAT